MIGRALPALLLLAAGALVAACGDDGYGDGRASSSPADSSPGVLSVEEARAAPAGERVTVRGLLYAPAGKPVLLCSSLAESFPPQCAGARLTVEGLDLASVEGLSTSAGNTDVAEVSWSDRPAELRGTVDGDVLTVES